MIDRHSSQIVVLIEFICRRCRCYFYRCPPDFKNVRYCSAECKNIARAEHCKIARRKHSKSRRGKLGAACRQARFRKARKIGLPLTTTEEQPVVKEESQEADLTEPLKLVTDHTTNGGGNALTAKSALSSCSAEREQRYRKSTQFGNLKKCNICGLEAYVVVPLRKYLAIRMARARKARLKDDPY